MTRIIAWARDVIPARAPSWRALTVMGLAVALIVAALVSDGFRSAKLDLDEASVWATNGALEAAGRINTQIGQVEVRSGQVSHDVDVLQRGREVALLDPGVSLEVVDPLSGSPSGKLELTNDVEVASGGGVVGLWSGSKGRLWLTPFDQVVGVDLEDVEDATEIPADAHVAIGPTGAVFAASSEESAVRRVEAGVGDDAAAFQLKVLSDDLQMVVVGETPVVLDRTEGRLQMGDRVVDLATYGAAPALQEGEASGAEVLVATDTSLIAVGLGDGEVRTIDDGGTGGAVRPVRAGLCSYGAWVGVGSEASASGGPRESVACDGVEIQSASVDLASTDSARLRFRANGSHVILNDLEDGRSIVAADGTFVVVDNWDDLPQEQETDVEDPDDTSDGPDDCSDAVENTTPEPQGDEGLGARPGIATVLKVLANDRDADCDVLVVTSVDTSSILPAGAAEVVPVDRGHAIQFTSAADVTGAVTFAYLVSDGRSAPVAAEVTVTVKDADAANERPVQNEPRPEIALSVGQTVSVNVLESFTDPDGDPLVLLGAALPAEAKGDVRTQTDGTVTYTDADTQASSFVIDVQVSDGRDGAVGELGVRIEPDPEPIARNDHAVGLTGRPITVDVLANDTGIDGEDPLLTSVTREGAPDLSIVTDTVAGHVVLTAPRAGSFRVAYQIASGGKDDEAWIRFDISDPASDNRPPVAVRDVASVIVGGTTTVDLLANDTDPDLDVLVVSSVGAPSSGSVTAELLEHRAVRLTAAGPEPQPVLVEYHVTDGKSDPVTGQILVQVTTTGQVNQPPTAKDDRAVVRVGQVVTVAVLLNDLDPDGDQLTVSPTVSLNQAEGADAAGVAFVSQNTVRFVADDRPGTVTINYEITDSARNADSALVRVTIVPAGQNRAPVPRSLEARTTVGRSVRIDVPTNGIDPDGDAVTLAIATQGTKGTAALGDECDCLVYTPAAGAVGTDEFTYTATDPGALVGEATVRVGIAALPGANRPPVALPDLVRIRPEGMYSVPVLANDSDPDGDDVDLVDEPIRASGGVHAEVVGDRVRVTAGGSETTTTFAYQVTDGKQPAQGFLTVEVSRDAPPVAPIARDDDTPVPSDRAAPVVVDILANDEDPEGTLRDLEVEVAAIAADVASFDGGRRRLSVRLGDQPRVVPYTITDRDGQSATAIVRVPSSEVNLPPRLKDGIEPIEVPVGETVAISISDHAEDPEGNDVLLVTGDHHTATAGSVVPVDATTLRYTAPSDGPNGPAAIRFRVTDGASSTDPGGVQASLALQVLVIGGASTPPVFEGAALTVEVGGEETIDLVPFVTDPDPGDLQRLTFADVRGGASGVTASLDGTELTVTAGSSARKGTMVALSLTVTDGTTDPVVGQVRVSVVGSTAPLAVAVDDRAEAASGRDSSVAVLANDSAPPELDLVVERAQIDPALGTARVSGDNVIVTPSETFVGVANVSYTINDSLADPDREVSGTVVVTVRDRPAPPTPPTVAASGSRYVVLDWQPPNAHGGVIDRYEVTSLDGSVRKDDCTTTNCRIGAEDGLENGTTYRFEVRAHNNVTANNNGWSDPSGPSLEVTPDTRPSPSTVGPTLEYVTTLQSGQLRIRWPAAGSGSWTNDGTPIEEYQIRLSPPPRDAAQLQGISAGTTSLTLRGLIDGTVYRAEVRARNSATAENGGWSDWSPTGNDESPASAPSSPTNVAATRVDDPVQSTIRVTWSPPANPNATELIGYSIEVERNGSATPVDGIGAARDFYDVAGVLGATYRFRVVAINKAGDSEASGWTSEVVGFTRPDPMGPVIATATGNNREIRLEFSNPSANGDPIDYYRVATSPGGVEFVPASGGTVTRPGLINGTPYIFEVAACNRGQDVAYCGESRPSNSAVPYGPPAAPTVSAAHIGGNTIRLSWSAPPSNGRPIDNVEISVDGGAWQRVGLSGYTDRNTGYSQTHSISARAISAGLTGPAPAPASARAPDPPPSPTVRKAQGGANTSADGTCPVGRCSYIIAQLRNFAPGSVHNVTSTFGSGDLCTLHGPSMRRVTVDGNGNADVNTGCYAGNTSVGIIVDGVEHDFGPVNWRR